MKRLIICILSFLFLCGCGYNSRSEEEEVELYENMDTVDQTRHYRPVHLNEDWMIAQTAKRLTLRAGSDRLQLAVRYDPDEVVIRKRGVTVGRVKTLEDASLAAWLDSDAEHKLVLSCSMAHESSVSWKDSKYAYHYDEKNNAWSSGLEVRKLQSRRLYSVAVRTDDKRKDVCDGVELESPFSAVGLLIFHEDAIPLELRTAMAWYVTVFPTECAGSLSN
ncbi:MAG: hypothetical protein IJ268_12065 [Proteobacteria bacterium]|nr:hypothetical protein [Pseudomonadota bacterium]